jgi:hypothetical protein
VIFTLPKALLFNTETSGDQLRSVNYATYQFFYITFSAGIYFNFTAGQEATKAKRPEMTGIKT